MFRTMGQRTAVNSSVGRSTQGQGGRSNVPQDALMGTLAGQANAGSRLIAKGRSLQLKVDMPMLLAVITLLIFGVLMVYSASYDYSFNWYGDRTIIFKRQLLWLALGSASAVILAFIDYHRWRNLVVYAMLGTMFMLVIVLFVSDMRNGAVRTLYEGSIQPSELAKFMTVVYLAVWLYSKRDKLGEMSFGLAPLAMILGILSGLIVLQPDLSAVITILMLGGLMFFLAGGDLRQIGILLIIALLVGYGVVMLSETGSQRIQDYISGLKDPTQGSYHVRRSFEAFAKGGWFGVGIGEAETKLTGLPVPPTDSIFAVVGEETGVFGAVALVSLYVVLLWRGFVIAGRAPDQLGALLAAGLTLWISIEAFINMSVMVNLLPFAGNALPFISAGGSSLVMTLLAVGILLNISRLSVTYENENERSFNAVVDLRGRDWRRRVSGANRSASYSRRRRDQS